jgi:photosystem II stability/assembly factor-like uncharacterized protein
MNVASAGRRMPRLLTAVLLLAGIPALGGGVSSAVTSSWQRQSPVPTGQALQAVDMVSAAEAWAVGNNGAIIHTTNGGVTWSKQQSRTTDSLYAVDFVDSLHGVAVGNMAHYTTDGGATWLQSASALGSVYNVELADSKTGFISDGSSSPYKTIDGGKTWARVSLPRAVGRIQFFDASNGVASATDGVLHTADGGRTWSFVAGHGGFFVSPQIGFSVTNTSSERTTDGGRTWQPRGSLPANTWLNEIFFIDAQNGWGVGAESDIVRTTDGGLTWTNPMGGVYSSQQNPNNRYPLEGVSFADPLRGIAVGVCGSLLTTSDGGAGWTSRLSGSCTVSGRMAFTDANHLWTAQKDGEILYTTDGGARWNRSSLPIGVGEISQIDFVDDLNGWLAVRGNVVGDQFVFHSTDGGRSWVQQGAHDGGTLYGIDALDARTIVAVGYNCCVGPRIDRSTDGGQTWSSIPDPLYPYGGIFQAVDFPTATTGWIAGRYGALLKSTDAGATWVQQNPLGLFGDGGPSLFNLSFADANNGWVVASGGPSFHYLLHTTDGGQTWTKQSPAVPGDINNVFAVSPSTVWIGTAGNGGGSNGYVARSTNGGATWTAELPEPNSSFDGIVAIGDNVWASGLDFTESTGSIWHRGGASPPPSTSNLLRNGGFELDANGDGRPDSWTSNPRMTRSAAVVHGGAFAARHQAADDSSYVVSQKVAAVAAGSTYSFGGWVNIPGTTDAFSLKLQVRWLDSANATIATKTVKTYTASTAGWVQAAASLVAPAGSTSAQVRMVVGSLNATIYADDFSLTG